MRQNQQPSALFAGQTLSHAQTRLSCEACGQVPLLWTVYALVSFREFRIMEEDHAARRCACVHACVYAACMRVCCMYVCVYVCIYVSMCIATMWAHPA